MDSHYNMQGPDFSQPASQAQTRSLQMQLEEAASDTCSEDLFEGAVHRFKMYKDCTHGVLEIMRTPDANPGRHRFQGGTEAGWKKFCENSPIYRKQTKKNSLRCLTSTAWSQTIAQGKQLICSDSVIWKSVRKNFSKKM